jgi:hypothetical protein
VHHHQLLDVLVLVQLAAADPLRHGGQKVDVDVTSTFVMLVVHPLLSFVRV